MAKVGRPTKYDPAMCEKVVELMSEGYAKVEVAVALGITRETLNAWDNDSTKPEFSDAVRLGEEASEAWWMTKGRVNLENREFSATLWYMNMKNRHGWRDRIEEKSERTMVTRYPDPTDVKGE